MSDRLLDAEHRDADVDGDPDGDLGATSTASADGSKLTNRERRRERRRNRVSRWDRPPPPKDWRYFVGMFGKILITTGVLMFGFVGYQLWGTGIETARAQSKLRGDFQERIAETDETPIVGFENWVPATRDEPGPETADQPADDASDATAAGTPVDQPLILEPSPVVPGGVDLSDYAIDQDVPIIPDEAFALLEIPAIGTSHHVLPGVNLNDLKKGPGHYPSTPLPGQLGNAAIAGHRTTYGAPFFDLDDLLTGDELIVTMVTGDRFVYRVTEIEVVGPDDSWVISTRDPTVAELTLTTCDPKYTAKNRLVVHSVLDLDASAQIGLAEFYDLDDADDEPFPGDDPTVVSTVDTTNSEPAATGATTVETTTAAPTITESSDAGSSDDPTATATATDAAEPSSTAVITASEAPQAPPDDVDVDDDELDAFTGGWFDDREAFPQIGLWALALLIISLLTHQVSKKTRHHSIGILVGIAPFFVALYFFYQNVNRLLPPGF